MTSTVMLRPEADMKPRLMAPPVFGLSVTWNLKFRNGSDARWAMDDV
jgi:hypothetical protein